MNLFPHQKEALETIQSHEKNPGEIKGVILAFKMGMGKTRTALELLNTKTNLVVCNKSNIAVWINEIKKYYSDYRYYVYHKDYNNLEETININDYNIIITSYEMIRQNFKQADPSCFIIRLSNFYEPLPYLYNKSNMPKNCTISEVKKPKNLIKNNIFYGRIWNYIIADESQRFTAVNSQLYKAMVALRGKNYCCLSGTPIVNYGIDLYSQYKFMGLELIPKDWNYDYYDKNNLQKYIISKDFSDTDIKLTESKFVNVTIKLSEPEKKMYNAVIDMLKEKYVEFKCGNETFAAPLAMLTRLRQICICPYTITSESKKPNVYSKVKCPIPEPVIETLIKYIDKQTFANLLRAYPGLYKLFKGKFWKDQIEQLKLMPTQFFSDPDLNSLLNDINMISHWSKIRKILKIIKRNMKFEKKIVIFSSFVSFLNVLNGKIINKKLGKPLQIDGSTKNRDDIIDLFSTSTDHNILLCSYKTGGVGIDLTAAESLVLVEPWWNSAVEQQAICRIHRIGQKKNVRIYSVIVENSVEMHMLNIQEKKKESVEKYGLTSGNYSRIGNSITKEVIEKVVYGEYMI